MGFLDDIFEWLREREEDEKRARETGMPRRRLPTDREFRLREQQRAERETESEGRSRTVREALQLLSGGAKEAAGERLESVGISTRQLPDVERAETELGTFALETPREAAEAELRTRAGLERESTTQRAQLERETRAQTDPTAFVTSLFAKKSRGEALTSDEEESLKGVSQLLLSVSGRDKSARDLYEQSLFTKMSEGRSLDPMESEYLNRTVLKNEPKSEEERITRKVGKSGIEGLSPGEKHIWDTIMIPKTESKYLRQLIDLQGLELRRQGEERRTREGEERTVERKEGRRDVRLDRVRQAIRDVEFRHERRRGKQPLGKGQAHQEQLAKLEADEQAEIQAIVERAKKQYPELAKDIDAFLTAPRKRPSLIDIFRESLK